MCCQSCTSSLVLEWLLAHRCRTVCGAFCGWCFSFPRHCPKLISIGLIVCWRTSDFHPSVCALWNNEERQVQAERRPQTIVLHHVPRVTPDTVAVESKQAQTFEGANSGQCYTRHSICKDVQIQRCDDGSLVSNLALLNGDGVR